MKYKDDIWTGEESGKGDLLDGLLGSATMRRFPAGAPEGYFASLSDRLRSIPEENPLTGKEPIIDVPVPVFEEETATPKRSLWARVKPYVAVAAAFLVMVTVGNAILKTSLPSSTSDKEALEFALVVQTTNPYYYMMEQERMGDEEEDDSALTDDEIVQYLISSGISVEHLSFTANNYER